MTRYAPMLGLLVITISVAIPSRSARSAPSEAMAAGVRAPDVPEAVRAAAEEGRYWRASRLMGDYLETVADTPAPTLLYTAELHAGWDDWPTVAELLEGRDWLDQIEGGAGWALLGRSHIAAGRPEAGADALGRYLRLAQPSDHDRGVAELRRGLALAESVAPSEAGVPAGSGVGPALEAFERAGRLLPWFQDWAALLAAEAAVAAGDTAGVRERIQRAGPLAEGAAWRLRMRAAQRAGDSLGARTVALETAESDAPQSTRAAAWAELGSLRLEAGDEARARAAFVEAMEAPGTTAAVDAARNLTGMRPTSTEWLRIADIYARHGNAPRAVEGYENWLRAGGGTVAERHAVRLRLGRALFNAGRYDRAERELLELAAEDVDPAIGARALHLAGRAQYRQGRSQEGQRTLARLPERFPGQETVTESLFLLADLKHDDRELADARRYYRQAAEAAPHLNEAGLALMRLGGLEMLEGSYDEAAAIFEEYRRLHPDGRRWAQATYWAGRAYARLGRDADARARLMEVRTRDPISYHGVLAAERLGVPLLDIPMGDAPARDAALEARVREGMRRADVLAELGRRGDLVREVDRLRSELRGQEAAEYALAEALNDRAFTISAINLGWELRRRADQWNDRLLRIIYPFPFRSLVALESRDRGLDPYLVAAVIRRESAFNPTVTSGAGAIGLMQVMPETGRILAREVNLDGFQPDVLRQPEVNVHLGTRYLSSMLARFDQDLPLVLSAYNAGPTRAVRWRELPEARDAELFTERIPYTETRDYVRNVVLHRALYRALYSGSGTEPGA